MDADQIVDILMDVTVEARGSDDLYDVLEFRVDEPYVRFDVPIEGVGVGEDLIVTGITNREDGVLITVTTTEGPTDLTGFAEVEEGKFTVTIDTTDAKEGKYLLKAEDPDDNIDEGSVTLGAGVVTISVKDVNVEPDEVLAGENVTITITVENTGGIMGTYTPDVTVNGETIEVKEVTIFAGEEKEIVIEYTTPSMGGKYTVTADGEEDKFEVVGAEFEITELTVTESVKPDENVMITAVITNVGTIEGTKTIVAKMNDTEIGSEAVTLAPNATETVTFITTAPSEEGEYTITVDGETATFTVKTPGFEAVFAIVGLLAVAYLVNRRRKK
jgi:PGF-CTERM protein